MPEKLVEQINMIVMNLLEKQRLESDIDRAIVSDQQVREIIREELPSFLAKSITTIEGNLQLLDSRNIIVGSTTGSKIGTSTGQRLGFFNKAPTTQPTALTTQKTSITHTSPGTEDFAIQDLVQNTGFGFTTKDEGNTALVVILNLQTRVAQLETKLQSLGLLA